MNKFILLVFFATVVYCKFNHPLMISGNHRCLYPDVNFENKIDSRRFRSYFRKVSEVKFPVVLGLGNELQSCTLKCVNGNWLGPFCSQTPNSRFMPKIQQCVFHNEDPLLEASFENYSIHTDANFSHGAEIVTRCKHFGLYKLTGDSRLRCENGVWSSKLPRCVPTSVVTNYSDGSPPTIQYIEAKGSASVNPHTGELYVLPHSTILLDCIWPIEKGNVSWKWNKPYPHYVSWASDGGNRNLNYRLVISSASSRDTDFYTCTSTAGSNNTVSVKVTYLEHRPATSHSMYISPRKELGWEMQFISAASRDTSATALLLLTTWVMGVGHISRLVSDAAWRRSARRGGGRDLFGPSGAW